jgi:hypothetical protein
MSGLFNYSAKRERAEKRFAGTQGRRPERTRGQLDQEQEARAGYEKTARLKSLRLAKEAAEKARLAEDPQPPAPKTKKG